ncbi:hypothetical protein [Rhodococcus sovatensis]|uniref:Uncharacterized protein n=1 Tax=Rhodococcus sovatensis TaxID=1805840 RepID=A0ABZ2PI81_9NOCA
MDTTETAPFAPASEAEVCNIVLGNRRHGIEELIEIPDDGECGAARAG